MGLLEMMNSDQGLLGLHLMAAAAPRERRVGFGEGLLSGLQGVQAQRAAEEERKARRQMQEMQMRQQQMQLAALEAEQRKQQGVDQAFRGAMRTPEQAAMQQFGGPTVAAAQAAPGMAPQIDQAALLRGLMQADPRQAFQMMQPKPDEQVALSPGQVLYNKTKGQEVFRAPDKPAEAPADYRLWELSGAKDRGIPFDQWDLARRRAGAASTQVSYGQPVAGMDAQGNPVFLQPSKDGSAPHVIPGMRPPKSAAEERADMEKAGRARQGQQMLSVLNDAEQILKAGKATSSGIGAIADIGARSLGISTAGAQDAARLQAMGGWLVANVPRMEGPQSNFDVQNYQTMAGKVADNTVPIPERLAALGEVRRLQRKYAEINGVPIESGPAASAQPAAGSGWSIRPVGSP